MQHNQAIAHITNRMKAELSKDLTYHSFSHTIEVLSAAEKLAKTFRLTEIETQLLLTAAAFHDSGFILDYKHHEKESCLLAKEILPEFDYHQEEIESVCSMIMATKVPQSPRTKLEEILCDADLSYLSKNNYFKRADQLFQELNAFSDGISVLDWIKRQIDFLETHSFWTRGSLQAKGEQNKEKILKELNCRLINSK